MAKDYAKRVYTTTRKPKQKQFRVEIIILLIILLLCSIGYWLYSQKNEVLQTSFLRIKELVFHQHHAKNNAVSTKIANSINSQEPDVHFDFYNELPKLQVKSPEAEENIKPKIHDPEADRIDSAPRYILQLGVFKEAAVASQLRLSLLLSGCEAEVVTLKTANGSVYRVQRGPFINEAEAKKLQRQLQKKGIEAALKKA